MKKVKAYLLNNVLSLALFIIIIIVSFLVFNYLQSLEYPSKYLKSTNTISGIISIITAGGILIAVMQLSEAQYNRKTQLIVVKQERTVQMMKEFADILIDVGYVSNVYMNSIDYYKLINRLPHTDYRSFRMDELKKLFTVSEQAKLLNFNNVFDKGKSALVDQYCLLKLNDKSDIELLKKFKMFDWDLAKIDSKEEKAQCLDLLKEMETDYQDSQWKLINRLEWFSTYFNVGLADEDVAYQSLHQIYISTAILLYPIICAYNNGPITKHYYKNVINLYVRWSEMLMKKQKQVQQEKEKFLKREEKIELKNIKRKQKLEKSKAEATITSKKI